MKKNISELVGIFLMCLFGALLVRMASFEVTVVAFLSCIYVHLIINNSK